MNPKAEPNNPSEQGTTLAGPPGSRDNNFNLLRFLLASLVIVSHAPELVDGDRHREILTRIFHTISFGELAVDGFFLLSGFLIVQSWDRRPNLLHFIMNRVLRIYPGFLVASLISVYVVGPLGADSSRYFAQVDFPMVLVRALALLEPVGGPAFEGQPYPILNGALWTILYEFRCYMIVAVLGLFSVVRRRWPWLLIAAAIALFTQSRLVAFFLVGGCFYLYRDHIRYTNRRALLSAIVVILCLFNMRSTRLALLFPGAYLLFWFAFLRSPILAHFRDYPDISYGLYLYGWPMQKLFHWYLPSLSPWWLIPLVLTSAGICGTFSWYLVEKPFLSLKRNRKRTRTDEVKPEMDVANLG
jgi:peptidoglycan/LPS O-acetylase OafA/YrhL